MTLRWLFELVARLVAPWHCAACDVETETLFCEGCAATLEAGRDARAVFVYGGAIADAIVRLKYRGRSDLAARLGKRMAERVASLELGAVDLVVPVPLHALRAAERGFNQSALLARPIARALRVPLGARVLARTRHTPRQATLDREDRLVNVRAAFRCRQPRAVVGKRILLIDDVRTTGATIAECMAVLSAAGASEVVPFVLAARDELPVFR